MMFASNIIGPAPVLSLCHSPIFSGLAPGQGIYQLDTYQRIFPQRTQLLPVVSFNSSRWSSCFCLRLPPPLKAPQSEKGKREPLRIDLPLYREPRGGASAEEGGKRGCEVFDDTMDPTLVDTSYRTEI